MGTYLNCCNPYHFYRSQCSYPYFVDKTDILKDLVPLVDPVSGHTHTVSSTMRLSQKYVCITRPRRFGKTIMANMVSAYFGKGIGSADIFDTLKVSSYPWYRQHLNQHNVIHIDFSEVPRTPVSYQGYIERIERRLLKDLMRAYPEAGIAETDALWDAFNDVALCRAEEKFIFVFDEWDYIYHQNYVSDQEKQSFTKFLSALLKDKTYVEMVYMTGILPIAKYSSGSELNMFCEYTMARQERFSESFGFTGREVDDLYSRYMKLDIPNRNVTREGLRSWYDGYHTRSGERVYNPRSVVLALENNELDNYWTDSGPYDELFYYIGANVDAVREDVGRMIGDIPVPVRVQEYAATAMELKTRDEIFSAMVVYGFLNYENGCVSIPNRELMGKFSDMVRREPSLGNVYRLTRESGRMLEATKSGDIQTMEEILQYVHDTESPLQEYSSEAELSLIVKWAYLQALDTYRIEREDKAGRGYVDFIFYPYRRSDDAIILELKKDHTPEEAIAQIKDREYALRFAGKIGEKPEYTGRVLAVGMSYDSGSTQKKHRCRVEILRDRLS